MSELPSTEDSLLVRTDFGDDAAWEVAKSAALAENEDGFRAHARAVDDPDLADTGWQDLRQSALTLDQHAAVLFVVDGPALQDDHPILVVDLSEDAEPPFRCIARELWGVDNNLNLANMDWDEFARATDDDGVFRGFS